MVAEFAAGGSVGCGEFGGEVVGVVADLGDGCAFGVAEVPFHAGVDGVAGAAAEDGVALFGSEGDEVGEVGADLHPLPGASLDRHGVRVGQMGASVVEGGVLRWWVIHRARVRARG